MRKFIPFLKEAGFDLLATFVAHADSLVAFTFIYVVVGIWEGRWDPVFWTLKEALMARYAVGHPDVR